MWISAASSPANRTDLAERERSGRGGTGGVARGRLARGRSEGTPVVRGPVGTGREPGSECDAGAAVTLPVSSNTSAVVRHGAGRE